MIVSLTNLYTSCLHRIERIDRQYYHKSGNIPKTEGGQIVPNLCSSPMIYIKLDRAKKRLCGAKVFHREHALACPQLQSYDIWWSRGLHLYHNFNKCGGKTSSGGHATQ